MALRFSVLSAATSVLLVAGCSSDGGTNRTNVNLTGTGGLGVAGNTVVPTGSGSATVTPQGQGGALPQGQGGSTPLGKGGTPVVPPGSGGAVGGAGNTPGSGGA